MFQLDDVLNALEEQNAKLLRGKVGEQRQKAPVTAIHYKYTGKFTRKEE